MVRSRRRNSREDALADECAAFLTGPLTDRLETDSLTVPIWAWSNLLAHGSPDMLADAVSRPSRRRLLNRRWWIARAQLADPFKLEFAARTDVPFWTAHQWVNTVTAELHRHHHRLQSS